MKSKSQNLKLMKHMVEGNPVTAMTAFRKLGITQLASRLIEIRKAGVSIDKKWQKKKNVRYVEYTLTPGTYQSKPKKK